VTPTTALSFKRLRTVYPKLKFMKILPFAFNQFNEKLIGFAECPFLPAIARFAGKTSIGLRQFF